jgi:importin subunit alpha-6/7
LRQLNFQKPQTLDVPNLASIICRESESAGTADPEQLFAAITEIRRRLSLRNAPIDEVIRTGVIPRLVQLMVATQNPDLKFELGWVLTNVASGHAHQTNAVVEGGGLDAFLGEG